MNSIFNRPSRSQTRMTPHQQSLNLPSQKFTLKTILKNRQTHKIQNLPKKYPISNRRYPQTLPNNQIQNSKHEFVDRKIRNSKSLDLNNNINNHGHDGDTLPGVHQRNRFSIGRTSQQQQYGHTATTVQPESYQQLVGLIQELDKEAELLIRKKIAKMSTKQSIITLKSKGKDEISQQIEKLVSKIKSLKSEHLETLKMNQNQIKQLMDRKINLLQKLLAQNQTQSFVLKKYFFAISALNQQKKSEFLLKRGLELHNPTGKRINLKLGKSYQLPKTHEPEPICLKSSNQLDYNSPQAHEYETYRHKSKQYAANPQPFPRSSYNREFLVNPKTDNFSCKNLDNHTIFGKSRLSSSTYSKDFQRVRTEIVDYRELDSFRNKIKNIEVSYNFRNRKEQNQKHMQKSRKFLEDQLRQRYQAKASESALRFHDLDASPASHNNNNNNNHNHNNLLITESQIKFRGQAQVTQSQIKNRKLTNLKYSYKTLINNNNN